ncbi:tripartite tricarboxylate transporter permease [Ancylobacter mangrovi]|uniref:Tripartite tricarboxylate transporter permease n=1 Tax=Ancylobacter mangrovi TaxID=2972472 RepID=A0A9X2PNY2_9HYPH|nr:tripartite tricarboxylate transporter permease [Ancylobacter mangrovi]MCS0497173.1 tripartite tricarboxylate transporter permease [Ancylobacter mangrovi]MCS0505011.1 tripartite tricarboxylate transporter permease [Ancylobacter mangrovi]
MLTPLIDGFARMMDPWLLLMCFLGTFAGTLVGVLPGLGPSAAIAVLLPITYGVDPLIALVAMAGIYYGAMYGGTITSVLLNVPGESASVVTTYDGHPLAKQGKGGVALGLAAIGSFIAGTIGLILLSVLAIPLARMALVFGPPEYFAVTILAFVMVSSLARGNMVKSFLSLFLGLLLATVGQDIISGQARLTWGTMELIDGIGFIPAVVGLFGLSEIVYDIVHPQPEAKQQNIKLKIREILPSMADLKQTWAAMVRGGFLGFFLGILPGAGATIASFVSYGVEKQISKTPERFGQGALEGVAGPESANNAASSGAFVPLLALGIPGSATTAVLIGAFIILGIQPGPRLFTEHADVAWGLIASMYVGNLMLLAQNILLVPFFIWLFVISERTLPVIVASLCVIGVYSVDNSMWDIWLMIAFTVLGYGFRASGIPAAPLVIALVLGPDAENALRQSLVISMGSPTVFFERPISLALLVVAFLCLLYPLVRHRFKSVIETE